MNATQLWIGFKMNMTAKSDDYGRGLSKFNSEPIQLELYDIRGKRIK